MVPEVTCRAGKCIPRMLKEAGFSGRFTNHSLRATSATRLFDAGLMSSLSVLVLYISTIV